MNTQLTADDIEHPYRYKGQATLEEARRYCARLATSHYENFLVTTLFCPVPLRPHFYSVYAFCRISDDLGDEIGDTQKSLILLNWWEDELMAMYAGSPRHPVFVALAETVRQFDIPKEPFCNLLAAFRQDQTTLRYPTYNDLLSYCVNSANPVGRLVLYLFGYSDEERQALSDHTCTALQLANFWQDMIRDIPKGRIYIPIEDMDGYKVSEKQITELRFSTEFADLIRFEVDRTYPLFEAGKPLVAMVDKRARLDIEMFTMGGMEVLRRIEKQGYDVLTSRPSIPKTTQLTMLLRRLIHL